MLCAQNCSFISTDRGDNMVVCFAGLEAVGNFQPWEAAETENCADHPNSCATLAAALFVLVFITFCRIAMPSSGDGSS